MSEKNPFRKEIITRCVVCDKKIENAAFNRKYCRNATCREIAKTKLYKHNQSLKIASS